jgi:hypothetical protein
LQSTADFAILQRLEISYSMVKDMQVIEQLKIEDSLFAEIATRAEKLHKSKNDVVNELLRKALNQDKKKRKYTDEEVRQMYAEAYGKQPVQPDEFEIEEEQMIEVWKDL